MTGNLLNIKNLPSGKQTIYFTQEELLEIFINSNDYKVERSPYAIYGYPSMVRIANFVGVQDGLELYARPTEILYPECKPKMGISWQFMLDGKWVGQGERATYEQVVEFGIDLWTIGRFKRERI